MAFDSGSLPTLSVRVSRGGDGRTVSVAGEIDLSNCGYFEDALLIALRDRPQRLVVDLRGLTFMDSTGAISLLAARELCGQLGCRLDVVLGQTPVRRLLEVSGVLGRFEVVPTDSGAPGSVVA